MLLAFFAMLARRVGVARLLALPMARETLAKIFDPFFTTKPSGTGLGLSITYGIVHDRHGVIEIDAEPGRGPAFALTFPAAPVAAVVVVA